VNQRYPGEPRYDDITLGIGMAMSPEFWNWVNATLSGQPQQRGGALVGYDFDGNERSRRTFSLALISEVAFPAMDAHSKGPALMTIKISPEVLVYKKGDKSPLTFVQAKDEINKQKMWLPENFSFDITRFGGDPSIGNPKLDAFTIKQNIILNPNGLERRARKEPGRVDMPALQLTFPETHFDLWMSWYHESVEEGRPANTNAALIYLAPDATTELMRLNFFEVGLTNLEVERYEAGKEDVAKVKATLYFERMELLRGSGNS
jgi:hypothetical protein